MTVIECIRKTIDNSTDGMLFFNNSFSEDDEEALQSDLFCVPAVGKICKVSDKKNVNFMAKKTIVQQLRNKVTHAKFGDVFFVSSFPQYDIYLGTI